MNEIIKRTVLMDGQQLIYFLEYKPVKNINLRILKDCSVHVSASRRIPQKEVDAFVQSKSAFVLRAIARFEEMERNKPQPKQYVSGETFYIQGRGIRLNVVAGAKNTISCDGVYIHLSVKNPEAFEQKKRLVTKFLEKESRSVYTEVLDDLYPAFQKYGVERPILRIRDMDTRWGSCLANKGIVTLNKRLIETPRVCIEYVVMHELCHFIHPNHSKQFYGFLSMMMPDWKERKALLERAVLY